MNFWKELLEFLTALPEHPDTLVIILAYLLALSIIFSNIYYRIVDRFRIRHIIQSILSAIYFIFSITWMLYYINRTFTGLVPIFILLLLWLINIIYINIRKKNKKSTDDPIITYGIKGNEKIHSCIISEITDIEE